MVARAIGKSLPHDSAHLHVSGQAAYTDDLPEPRDLLHLAVGMSAVAHANVRDLDLSAVLAAAGVVDTCTAADIPGENNYGSIIKDDPLLADGLVQYVGQPLFVVAAETVDAARKAAHKARDRRRIECRAIRASWGFAPAGGVHRVQIAGWDERWAAGPAARRSTSTTLST